MPTTTTPTTGRRDPVDRIRRSAMSCGACRGYVNAYDKRPNATDRLGICSYCGLGVPSELLSSSMKPGKLVAVRSNTIGLRDRIGALVPMVNDYGVAYAVYWRKPGGLAYVALLDTEGVPTGELVTCDVLPAEHQPRRTATYVFVEQRTATERVTR